MITKFKLYEIVNTLKIGLKIGDYVAFNFGNGPFYNGQITKIKNNSNFPYEITFSNGNTLYITKKEIKYTSPNKEDLEIYLSAQKYNL